MTAPTELVVRVHGDPVPQGSMVAFVRGNRAQLIPSNKKTLEPWRSAVDAAAKTAAIAARWTRTDGPLEVHIEFRLARPATAARRLYPHKKPDVDKLVRAILDGLSPHAIVDDSRIVALTAIKLYADQRPAGATITIRNGVRTDDWGRPLISQQANTPPIDRPDGARPLEACSVSVVHEDQQETTT